MKIGELAKKTGCKPVTIRFYEKKGLMPEGERTGSNYRNYNDADLARLSFIRHCRRHGMSLEEIEKLLLLANNPTRDHAEIHGMIQTHIANIKRQIAELEQLKESLENLMKNCAGYGEHCDILKSLGSQTLCEYCQKHKELDL